MVEVTERARAELKKALDAQTPQPEHGLRLTVVGPDEFGLGVDSEKEGDQIVQHEGSKVLMVENALSAQLDGVTIDIHETQAGPRLVMAMTQ